jgi:hypothetical protein
VKAERYILLYTLITLVVITAGYAVISYNQGASPASGNLIGHLLGVVGFVLMIMTETLYTIRKRSKRAARWGTMQSWLQFHIFTGIVGPYLVLLHTAWHFNGLAGAVTFLTVIVVISGFIGRYIYTSVPRTAGGVELESGDLENQITNTEGQLRNWLERNPTAAKSMPDNVISLPHIAYNTWPIVFGRIFIELGYRWRWWRAGSKLKGTSRRELRELRILLIRRRQLNYQIAGLAFVRRVLALWHTVHVPMGIILFTLAFFHLGATLYYVTLAR